MSDEQIPVRPQKLQIATFIQMNLDKFLLMKIFVFLVIVSISVDKTQIPETFLSWIRDQATIVMGAIIAMVTGRLSVTKKE